MKYYMQCVCRPMSTHLEVGWKAERSEIFLTYIEVCGYRIKQWVERLIEVFNKVNKIYLKNSKQKLAKCYGNLLDGQAIVISIVLMSWYNKENMSLYNFKRGCVITETWKCEHKGKKFVLQLHLWPV